MWAGGDIDANVDEMAQYALLQVDDGTASGRRLVFAQMMADLHRPQIAEGCPGAGMLGIRPPNRRADMCFLPLAGFTPPRSLGVRRPNDGP